MAETLMTAGGTLIVVWWITRPPYVGAPLWTWAAWRLPDDQATYVDLRTIHTVLDSLPVRRHSRRGGLWPDQGARADVLDVAALRRERDFTWSMPSVAARRRGLAAPLAAGAAGLAVAGVGAVPVVPASGTPMWSQASLSLPTGYEPGGWPAPLTFGSATIGAQVLEELKERFRAVLGSPNATARRTMVLPPPVRITPVDVPAPSDVMTLDLIQARLSAGLSTVVADAMATLLAMA